MHHIQRKILNLLMYAPSLTYAQMRPKGVESNHFAYHLEQIVKSGYVTKQDRKYMLSPEGLALADRVSHADMSIRDQPHIITAAYITNNAGQTLVFKHTFHPYMDRYGFPQGRIHFDEPLAESASREVAEKTGLYDIALTHVGMAYITAMRGDGIVSKLLAHVFVGKVKGMPKLAAPTMHGMPLWENLESLQGSQFMPGYWRIHELMKSTPAGTLFFDEIIEDLDAAQTQT